MQATDLSADLLYADLTRIVDEKGEPFESYTQCDLFLSTVGMLNQSDPRVESSAADLLGT